MNLVIYVSDVKYLPKLYFEYLSKMLVKFTQILRKSAQILPKQIC